MTRTAPVRREWQLGPVLRHHTAVVGQLIQRYDLGLVLVEVHVELALGDVGFTGGRGVDYKLALSNRSPGIMVRSEAQAGTSA